MDDKQDLDELSKIFAAGDSWLRKFGVIDPNLNPVAHNNIVANLYVIPGVEYVEYFMPQDFTKRWIKIKLYLPFWKLLFTNKDKLIERVVQTVKEYLDGYDVTVEVKRYKPSVKLNQGGQDEASSDPNPS